MRTAQLDTHHAALEKTAIGIAPAFTFKFDFSTPEDFTKWATMVYQAAEALNTKADSLQLEFNAKAFEKAEAEKKAKEALK